MTGWGIMENKAITLFGGTGDLTYRKLLPALYHLNLLGKLEDNFRIIAVGRREYSREDYLKIAKEKIREFSRTDLQEEAFEEFQKKLYYFQMDIAVEEDYAKLQEYYLKNKITRHFYYYAVAPDFFLKITNALKKYCEKNQASVIIEKPFGENLENARELNEKLAEFFGEKDIYHIDHYLGKEMIQNILTVRFTNALFKGIWNREFIENVQITAYETVGVETRAAYYDKAGAMKDMVQNHLLQVLSMVAMEEPKESRVEYMGEAQYRVLESIQALEDLPSQLVLGQYEGYLEEANIQEGSKTESFVAMKLFLDNERWRGIPFFIRTGKKMGEKDTKVVIQFKETNGNPGNVLVIRIQPEEGIFLQFNIKKPGTEEELERVSMDFCQSCSLENALNTPEAYERLLLAYFQEDKSLFSKWDQIVLSWNFIDNLMREYRRQNLELYSYQVGSLGPQKALEMVDWI